MLPGDSIPGLDPAGLLKSVTNTVMRSTHWQTFATTVNEEISKYLRKDNVEYYSDLTEDMKLFFMDKVEKDLRGTEEYNNMLDALGTTMDNKIASIVMQAASRDENKKTKVALTMETVASTVAVLLEELPSQKDSVRVLLNQELPLAIRPQVWAENLREPKARSTFEDMNMRDGLATVAVEFPDITRRCQDVLSTSYLECQGRTVLISAMRTVMSYLHATLGQQPLALYRCLIPLVFVLGSQPNSGTAVVEATSAFMQRKRPRFPDIHEPHATSLRETFSLQLFEHLQTVDRPLLHHLWTLSGGTVAYGDRDRQRSLKEQQTERRMQRATRRKHREDKLIEQRKVRHQKQSRREKRAALRQEQAEERQKLQQAVDKAQDELQRGERAVEVAKERHADAVKELELVQAAAEAKKRDAKGPTPRDADDGSGGDAKAEDGDAKAEDGDAKAEDGDEKDVGHTPGSPDSKKGGDDGKPPATPDSKKPGSAREDAEGKGTDGEAPPSPTASVAGALVEQTAELVGKAEGLVTQLRESHAKAKAALDEYLDTGAVSDDTASEGEDSPVEDVSDDSDEDVKLREDDPGEVIHDAETLVRLGAFMEDAVEHVFTDILSLHTLLYVWDQCVLVGFDVVVPCACTCLLHLLRDHLMTAQIPTAVERILHLHSNNIDPVELRSTMEDMFMANIREELGISVDEISAGLVTHSRAPLSKEMLQASDFHSADQQTQTDIASVALPLLSPKGRMKRVVSFSGDPTPEPRRPPRLKVNVPTPSSVVGGTPAIHITPSAAAAALRRLSRTDGETPEAKAQTPQPTLAGNEETKSGTPAVKRPSAASVASRSPRTPVKKPTPRPTDASEPSSKGDDGETDATTDSDSDSDKSDTAQEEEQGPLRLNMEFPAPRAPKPTAKVASRSGADDEGLAMAVPAVRAWEAIEPGQIGVELSPGKVIGLACPSIYPQFDRLADTVARVLAANSALTDRIPANYFESFSTALGLAIKGSMPFLQGEPDEEIIRQLLPDGSTLIMPKPHPGVKTKDMVTLCLKRARKFSPAMLASVLKEVDDTPEPAPSVVSGVSTRTRNPASVDVGVVLVARIMDAMRTIVLGTPEESEEIATHQLEREKQRKEILHTAQQQVYSRTFSKREVRGLQGKQLKKYKAKFKKLNQVVAQLKSKSGD